MKLSVKRGREIEKRAGEKEIEREMDAEMEK